MEKQVNFSHLIAVVIGIFIPLLIWGISVETRFTIVDYNEKSIENLKSDLKDYSKSNREDFDKVLSELNDIKLSLKDKQDKN